MSTPKMNRVQGPKVQVDLPRVRANVQRIARATGVPVIAVVKADAYGLGALRVVETIRDLVEAFYVFDATETELYREVNGGKSTIALVGTSNDTKDYVSMRVRPAVWTAERANLLRAARPVLCVDTGQQRFACAIDEVNAILNTGACDEAFTHATTVEQARRFRDVMGGGVKKIHAAGTALLEEPDAWLDAVRPGFALYEGTVRVTAPLLEAHDSSGPIGYSGFTSSTGRHGVFRAGYSDGFRAGATCLVNGQRRPVREVGMQSAFVELGPRDKAGDEVVLLGDGVTEREIAEVWGTSPHETLYRMCGLGTRTYL